MATTVLPHLHDTGHGEALLLLHAFPLEASMWDHQVAALSGRVRCLRPDAFGCGASPAPPDPAPGIDGWADAVLAALDAAGVGRVAVAGESMGGYLAFALLRRAPERVAGLALLATRSGADGDAARSDRTALAERLRADGPAALEELVQSQPARLLSAQGLGDFHISDPVRARIRRCTPEGLAWLATTLRDRPDSTALLRGVGVPALVVAGSEDAVIAGDEVAALAAAIAGARLEVVAGAGHLVNLEHPQPVSGLLGEWLDEVRW